MLTAAFALSHAFRTVVTFVAHVPALGPGAWQRSIGLVGAAFHITFGVMQLPMGVALDLDGPRRVVAVVFPAAVGGAILPSPVVRCIEPGRRSVAHWTSRFSWPHWSLLVAVTRKSSSHVCRASSVSAARAC